MQHELETDYLIGEEFYDEDGEFLADDLAPDERVEVALNRMEWPKTCDEQDEKETIERTSIDLLILSAALLQLPNIRKINIRPSQYSYHRMMTRQLLGSAGCSTSRMFGIVRTAVHSSNRELKEFAISRTKAYDERPSNKHGANEGIEIQALAPLMLLSGKPFASLETLDLLLETESKGYRTPDRWPHLVADFLAPCQQLQTLDLTFRCKFAETEEIFSCIAEKVRLPQLKNFFLRHASPRGKDLVQFLSHHATIQRLGLHRIRLVTVDDTWQHVLVELSKGHHKSLACVELYDIAENGNLMTFQQVCDVDSLSYYDYIIRELDCEDFMSQVRINDFFDEFEWLEPHISSAKAESWEGMQAKLEELESHIGVSQAEIPFNADGQWEWRI